MTQKASIEIRREYIHEFQQQVTLSYECVDEVTTEELITCCVLRKSCVTLSWRKLKIRPRKKKFQAFWFKHLLNICCGRNRGSQSVMRWKRIAVVCFWHL